MTVKPYEHKVQYYETDKMGIVHHSNYIRWFEESRIDFLEQVGMPYEDMEAAGIICPVVSVEKFNGIRLILSYEIRDKKTGELKCTGKSSHCYLDENGRPVSLKNVCPAYYELYKEAEGWTD